MSDMLQKSLIKSARLYSLAAFTRPPAGPIGQPLCGWFKSFLFFARPFQRPFVKAAEAAAQIMRTRNHS